MHAVHPHGHGSSMLPVGHDRGAGTAERAMLPAADRHRHVRLHLSPWSPCLTDDDHRDDLHPLFNRNNHRADFLKLYPGLDPLCARHGFGWDRSLAAWSHCPEWMLLTLARAAQVPSALDPDVASSIAIRLDDLGARHRPLDSEIRRLGILVRRLTSIHAHAGMRQLTYLLDGLRHDLQLHLLHDEMTVFPLSRVFHRNGATRAEFANALQFMADGHRDIAHQTDRLIQQVTTLASACTDPDLDLVGIGVIGLANGFQAHAVAEAALMPFAGMRLDAGLVVHAG